MLLCSILSIVHFYSYRKILYTERLDIHYIYIIEPLNTEATDNIRNVIAGATQYEYENEADELRKVILF